MSSVVGKKSVLLPDWEKLYRMGTPPWDTGRPAKELLRILDEGLVRPGAVLDVGGGTGANAVWLARRRFDVTAVDTSALAIERARLRCEQENALVRFVRANIFEFAKTGGRFDFILDAGFYHFIRQADLERYLDMLWWVTKPGSRYLVLAGAAGETAEGGPPQVEEEHIRNELGRLFELLDLRPFQFESSEHPEGYRGWSCLMQRPMLAE